MFKLIIKFWPVLLPMILYFGWFVFFRKKKDKGDKNVSKFEAQLWIYTLAATIVIAIVCLIIIALTLESNKGAVYAPATYKDGKLIPGRIVNE